MKLKMFSALLSAFFVVSAIGILGSKAVAFDATPSALFPDGYETNSTANFESDERRVFELVNRERERKGLLDLEWNANLARLARNYSRQMAQENFFSHYDAQGASVVERARQMKIKGWHKIGENLFLVENLRDYIAFAVKSWMKSPAHRQNILDPEWTTGGIGVAESSDGRIYVTQVFVED